jgi:hypothetical protein
LIPHQFAPFARPPVPSRQRPETQKNIPALFTRGKPARWKPHSMPKKVAMMMQRILF